MFDISSKTKLALTSALLILGVAAVAILVGAPSSLSFVAYVLLLMCFNLVLMASVSKYAVSYILFPFANRSMNYFYHKNLNERMISDFLKNINLANDLIKINMN